MGNLFSNFFELTFKDTDAGYRIPCENTVDFVIELLKNYKGRVCIITGAGISAHVLPTFRSNNNSGIWDILKSPILSKSHFYENPHPSWRLSANIRSLQIQKSLVPSLSHYVIHELIQHNYISKVITQNVDSLHHFDGDDDKVIELHGCVKDYGVCETCNMRRNVDLMQFLNDSEVPRCEVCGAVLKPPVAFFEDMIQKDLRESAYSTINQCDVLFLVGTHCAVDPVLSIAQYAKQIGAIIVEINTETTHATPFADVVLKGACDDVFEQIGQELFPGKEFPKSGVEKNC
ncbi:transcriptional regulator, Sir2 family protein [Tritrichomonas foetus]|uniref:Transcriptional regulator, Sir2 family protein n=1 Tax=Tritrichomonas foetus TaxID=1144522 RepID=A0A1J4K4M3_9EUKA|nr:transcriptional regulator, Sir2 family protein [Tritrichomonas foetus]|eukprot:OHT06393.1 transcriptional regulator, Sir2 family protein [Tritrichomonas foetus]